MPLVDPVTNSAGGDKTQEWQNKLVGKKIGETSDEVVSFVFFFFCLFPSFIMRWMGIGFGFDIW